MVELRYFWQIQFNVHAIIGNFSFNYLRHLNWLIFNVEGDFERNLLLPVTPMCDRNLTTVAKIQTGNYVSPSKKGDILYLS